MRDISETRRPPDGEISLVDILRSAWRRRWIVLCGALAGLLAGLIVHLAFDERFVVRLDMTITDMPLGTPSFVRDISASVLRKHTGTAVAILSDPRKGTVSMVERDVAKDAVAVRQAAMRNAAAALGDFLETLVSREYAEMQANFMVMPPSPESYAGLTRLRLHLSALEEGLLQPVVIVAESARPRGLALVSLIALGTLAGAAVAGAAALGTDALRGRGGGLPA